MKALFFSSTTLFLLFFSACKFEKQAPVLRTPGQRVLLEGKFRDIRRVLKERAMALKTSPLLWESIEIGILEADGEVWSLVENAKGRPLRRNKDLKGLSVQALGWKGKDSHFFEMDSFKVQFKKKWVSYRFDPVQNSWRPNQDFLSTKIFKR